MAACPRHASALASQRLLSLLQVALLQLVLTVLQARKAAVHCNSSCNCQTVRVHVGKQTQSELTQQARLRYLSDRTVQVIPARLHTYGRLRKPAPAPTLQQRQQVVVRIRTQHLLRRPTQLQLLVRAGTHASGQQMQRSAALLLLLRNLLEPLSHHLHLSLPLQILHQPLRMQLQQRQED